MSDFTEEALVLV